MASNVEFKKINSRFLVSTYHIPKKTAEATLKALQEYGRDSFAVRTYFHEEVDKPIFKKTITELEEFYSKIHKCDNTYLFESITNHPRHFFNRLDVAKNITAELKVVNLVLNAPDTVVLDYLLKNGKAFVAFHTEDFYEFFKKEPFKCISDELYVKLDEAEFEAVILRTEKDDQKFTLNALAKKYNTDVILNKTVSEFVLKFPEKCTKDIPKNDIFLNYFLNTYIKSNGAEPLEVSPKLRKSITKLLQEKMLGMTEKKRLEYVQPVFKKISQTKNSFVKAAIVLSSFENWVVEFSKITDVHKDNVNLRLTLAFSHDHLHLQAISNVIQKYAKILRKFKGMAGVE